MHFVSFSLHGHLTSTVLSETATVPLQFLRLYPPSQHTEGYTVQFLYLSLSQLCSEIRAKYLKITHSFGIHSMPCHSRFSFVPRYTTSWGSMLQTVQDSITSSLLLTGFRPFLFAPTCTHFLFIFTSYFSCLSLFLPPLLSSHFLPLLHCPDIFYIINLYKCLFFFNDHPQRIFHIISLHFSSRWWAWYINLKSTLL